MPSPDWDHGPVDFFNDFVGCSSGGKSDCYRYETLPSPVYGGAIAGNPEIGFDIPIDAIRVTAYIDVAADLRSNRQVTFPIYATQCGELQSDGGQANIGGFQAGMLSTNPSRISRVFCIFDNAVGSDVLVRSAELRITLVQANTDLQAEYLDFGPTIENEDYDLPSIADPPRFACCQEAGRLFAGVSLSGLQQAIDAAASEFGIRFTAVGEESGGLVHFVASGTVDRPVLELTYIRR